MRLRIMLLVAGSSILLALPRGYAQDWDSQYQLVDKWTFPKAKVSGYVFDACLDPNGTLLVMFFKDGAKIIAKDGIRDLTKVGEGPGEISRWAALVVEGDYAIDFEASGKIIYYRRNRSSYTYEKIKWLKWVTGFPIIRGAVLLDKKYYLAGFSLKPEPSNRNSEAYFLTVFNEKGVLSKQLIWKDFKGIWRGPPLLTSHIRKFGSEVWVILESEPILYIIDTSDDRVKREVHLEVPHNFKPIHDYMPVSNYTGDTLPKRYEEWILSYSRIENMLITEDHLVLQARTSMISGPRYFIMLYDLKTLALEKTYLTNHLLLAENNGYYYFFSNGDPGLDENANFVDIRIYKALGR